ncbi:hypothetical protein N2152v2_005573 [Parachlorella kessleri]
MQTSVIAGRTARPFGVATSGSRVQRRQQRHCLRTVAVAALEEPATADELNDAELKSMYKKFDQLIRTHTPNFKPGDKVTGTVYKTDQKGAYVDVGGKSGAFCATEELSLAQLDKASDAVGPGSMREFVVLREDHDLHLSIKRLEAALAWQRLRQLMEEEVSFPATVASVNRGGVILRVENIPGFCPGSQLGFRVQTFEELLGKEMSVKVTEVDEERGRLMLSSKAAAQAERTAAFQIGDVVDGTVMSVKPYGAFVDIGNGVSGLLHISQISHDRIANVDKVLSDGDRIKVMVLSQDKERGRLALCTKKLEPTPGDMLRDPKLVYDKAEEMGALFRARVAAAEAAARADDLSFAMPE